MESGTVTMPIYSGWQTHTVNDLDCAWDLVVSPLVLWATDWTCYVLEEQDPINHLEIPLSNSPDLDISVKEEWICTQTLNTPRDSDRGQVLAINKCTCTDGGHCAWDGVGTSL